MKIGIDIDGVILDFERELRTYAELYDYIELNKDGIKDKSQFYVKDRYNWTDEEELNFEKKYFINLSKEAHLILGAKEVINMLKNDGHELIIITARGGKIAEMKDVALEKLNSAGLVFDKYYWKQKDKLDVAKDENIDIMIDDSYTVCENFSKNGIKAVHFRDKDIKKAEPNENLQEVSNWGEIYRYINTIKR